MSADRSLVTILEDIERRISNARDSRQHPSAADAFTRAIEIVREERRFAEVAQRVLARQEARNRG